MLRPEGAHGERGHRRRSRRLRRRPERPRAGRAHARRRGFRWRGRWLWPRDRGRADQSRWCGHASHPTRALRPGTRARAGAHSRTLSVRTGARNALGLARIVRARPRCCRPRGVAAWRSRRRRSRHVASRRKTATARRAPARSSRPARKRAAPARRAAREPLLAPHQYRDLAGLALCALAAFSALVVWAGAGGGSLGGALAAGSSCPRAAPWRSRRWRSPCWAGACSLRADARRLRPFRVGGVAALAGVLSLLGSARARRPRAAPRRRLRGQRPARRGRRGRR